MVNSSKAWSPSLDAQPTQVQSHNAFELYLHEQHDTLFGYAQSLANCGRIEASLQVLAHIAEPLGASGLPVHQLTSVSLAILNWCITSSAQHQRSPRRCNSTMPPNFPSRHPAQKRHTDSLADVFQHTAAENQSPAAMSSVDCTHHDDPLGCAICGDLLCRPITAQCGHTFCADCCAGQTQCVVCGRKFRPFKPDVLVGRLVEKWWSPEANQRAEQLLAGRLLDEALKACNESLDKCEFGFF